MAACNGGHEYGSQGEGEGRTIIKRRCVFRVRQHVCNGINMKSVRYKYAEFIGLVSDHEQRQADLPHDLRVGVYFLRSTKHSKRSPSEHVEVTKRDAMVPIPAADTTGPCCANL
jgi:hypothetical protein